MKKMTSLILLITTLSLILVGCSSTSTDESSLPQVTNPGLPAIEEPAEPQATEEPAGPQATENITSKPPAIEEPVPPTTETPEQPSPKQYQIDVVVHPSGAGVITREPPEDVIDEGTEVTFTPTPEIGFSFDYWWIDGRVSENVTSIILNSNIVVEAYFLPDVEKIPPQVVQDYIDKENEIVLLDVRPFEDYQKDHIAGAISIPSDEIESRWNEIPPDKIVFVYASCIK